MRRLGGELVADEFNLVVDRVEVAARLIGLSSELTVHHSVRPQAASNA